jgi:hypothetical protein
MPDQTSVKSAGERIEDAMREIGTLLIAFAPLDAALTERREHVAVVPLAFPRPRRIVVHRSVGVGKEAQSCRVAYT